MDDRFLIGDFPFCLTAPEDLPVPDNFLKFRADVSPAYAYRLGWADALPALDGPVLARRTALTVCGTPEQEQRGLLLAGSPLAVYRETAPDAADVAVLRAQGSMLCVDTVFVSLLALERRMLARDGLILHCAYVRTPRGAILFSGPSGIGKSTQGGLWAKHRGAEVRNGDRALLQCLDGRWTARGWPVCGSSRICAPCDTPIRAVVMLEQRPENRAERLRPAQAFLQLFPQITVNRWNPAAAERAAGLLERLIAAVPVLRLGCTVSAEAVDCLEAVLEACP